MSQFFSSGGQSIGVSASASVLPMNIQDWFPLGWTGWIPLEIQQTLCTLGPRDLTKTETGLCLSISCGGTGQQWTATGTGISDWFLGQSLFRIGMKTELFQSTFNQIQEIWLDIPLSVSCFVCYDILVSLFCDVKYSCKIEMHFHIFPHIYMTMKSRFSFFPLWLPI